MAVPTHPGDRWHNSKTSAGGNVASGQHLVTDGAGGFTYAAASGAAHAHEPPTSGTHKILVKRTSNFTTLASNDNVPDYSVVLEDTMTDSWWDAGDPDGFVVTADYDGLDAVFTASAAWADPGSSAYVEGKMYFFPAASGRNRPIHATDDEDYLLKVEQHPATDNVNHFISVKSDPVTVGTGDRLFVAWRTSNSQTAITYNGRTSLTLGAYIVTSTASDPPAESVTDHAHRINVFNGDGSQAVFEISDEPIDPEQVFAFVGGSWTAITVSGSMNTTITFGSAPSSGTGNVVIQYPALVV